MGTPMRMRLVFALVLAAACAGAATAQPARAATDVEFGIQDDAWLDGGPGRISDRAATLQRMGFDVVRVTIDWSQTEPSPGDYDWRRADRLLGALHRHGLAPVVTLWGTPEWASRNGSPTAPPTSTTTFKRFARAIATRYPYVRSWLIWNEPNKLQWLRPASPSLYVTRLLNPGYAGIKSAIPSAKVGGGVTAPRGGRGGMTPVDFISGMARAGAHLDAYAHNPYPVYPGDTPYSGGCSCKVITMATLERLLSNVGRAFPRARIWLTEYAYQTKPDPFGVSLAQQAKYIGEAARRVYTAPKVDMLIHYLYRDEPDLARWQSGLETVKGKPKPALDATMLPLMQVSRHGTRTVLWGQVRPGSGAQAYMLQRWTGSSWVAIGGVHSTSARGYLTRAISASRGTSVRLWYPARGIASPTLVVQ
jgi:polysaccharide biosynthesis protein PslG